MRPPSNEGLGKCERSVPSHPTLASEATPEVSMIQVLHFLWTMIRYVYERGGFSTGAAVAAPDPSVADQARLFPGQDLAAAAGDRSGRGEEHRLRAAGERRDAGGLRVAPEG